MKPVEHHAAFLRTLFQSSPDLDSGLRQILDRCRQLAPDAAWHELDAVDFEADAAAFQRWLADCAPEQTGDIAAYYLGISDDGAEVHFDGTPTFDASDDTCDWACDYVYRGEEEWTSSQALFAFASISEQAEEEVPVLLYLLCLGYLGLLVQAYAPGILGKPTAVGFDDGDAFVVVGG